MKRRDFVKTAVCTGCACAIGAGIPACKNLKISDLKTKIEERKFIYKNEKALPRKVKIDICNLCQLNCAACWIRRDEELIKKYNGGFGYVPFKTFKKFVDEHPFVNDIELSRNGEIFLNPDLGRIMKYAYEKNICLNAMNGVNLNTLSEEMAENLVKYRFNAMSVSIDAATPETYPIYRRGGDFNRVMHNIKTINKYKKIYKREYPYMIYKFVVFGHNEHEIEAAKKLANELDMTIHFELNIVDGYSPLKNPEKVYELTGLKEKDEKKDNCMGKYIDEYKKTKKSWIACKDLADSPQINWNGDLLGCCCQHLINFKINVFKEGLLKALNDEKILYAKYMLSDFSVKPRLDLPCTDCFVYDMLKRDNLTVNMT